MKFKIAIVSIITCLLALPAMAETKTHVVERGETIASIAKHYGITEKALLAENPTAADFFYTGMVLTIPDVDSPNGVSESSKTLVTPDGGRPVENFVRSNESIVTNDFSISENEDKPGLRPIVMLEYGFLPKVEGVKGNNYTLGFSLIGNYYFMHKDKGVFGGAGIGWISSNYNQRVFIPHSKNQNAQWANSSNSAHFICIPVCGGYTFVTNNRMIGVSPLIGFDFNFCVAAKSKQAGYANNQNYKIESKTKKKTGISFRLGAELIIAKFLNVGASYNIPLNNGQKYHFAEDGYFAVNLGFSCNL